MHKAETNYSSYVSCIRIGNQPILPPLLDSCTRQTVRYMKQKAVELEQKLSSQNVTLPTAGYKLNDDPELNEINPLILPPSACRTSSPKHDDYIDNDANDDDHTTAGNVTFNSSSIISENEDEFLPAEHRTRRNSYTLERPSEVVLTYLRSLFINDDANNNNDDNNHKLLLQDGVTTTSSIISAIPVSDSGTNKSSVLDVTADEGNTVECHKSAVESINSNEHENDVVLDYCSNEVNNVVKNSDICSSDARNDNRNFDYYMEPIMMRDNSQSVHRANVITNGNDNCLISSATLFSGAFEHKNDNPRWLISDITVNNISPISSKGEMHANDRRIENCSNFRSFIDVGNNMNGHVLSSASNDEMDRKTYRSYARLFHQLKLKHIADLTELLEKQKNEQANLIAQLHSFFLPATKMKSVASPNVYTDQHSYCVSCSINDNNGAPVVAAVTPNNRVPEIENNVDNKKFDKKPIDESAEIVVIHEMSKQTTNEQKEIEEDESLLFKQQRKEAAATVINAAVRGYLTRRLFKTDRVSNLVYVIKDCIFIAMSLQNENELTLPDLDLQCRLLQQLAGSCNELNDIFSLPVKARMEIIANDRQKKLNTSLVKDISETETAKQVLKCKTNFNTVNKRPSPVNNRNSLQHKRQYFSASEKDNFNKSPPSILKQKYSTRQQQTDKRPWR